MQIGYSFSEKMPDIKDVQYTAHIPHFLLSHLEQTLLIIHRWSTESEFSLRIILDIALWTAPANPNCRNR